MEKITYFHEEILTPHIKRIRGVIGENMYLIEGRRQALLIDSGCGIGNIAKLVQELTHKPLAVALTHNHYDHCGGMYRFEEVYLNQKEREPNSVSYTDAKGREVLARTGLTDTAAITPVREVGFLDLEPGMVFDLGGARVEAITCPGHTIATMCFLILPERLLLSGDACHQITYLQFPEALPLAVFAKNLETLQKREGEWDSLLLSHAPDTAPKTLIGSMRTLCDRILMLPEGRLFALADSKGADARDGALLKAEFTDESRTICHVSLPDGSAEMLLRNC